MMTLVYSGGPWCHGREPIDSVVSALPGTGQTGDPLLCVLVSFYHWHAVRLVEGKPCRATYVHVRVRMLASLDDDQSQRGGATVLERVDQGKLLRMAAQRPPRAPSTGSTARRANGRPEEACRDGLHVSSWTCCLGLPTGQRRAYYQPLTADRVRSGRTKPNCARAYPQSVQSTKRETGERACERERHPRPLLLLAWACRAVLSYPVLPIGLSRVIARPSSSSGPGPGTGGHDTITSFLQQRAAVRSTTQHGTANGVAENAGPRRVRRADGGARMAATRRGWPAAGIGHGPLTLQSARLSTDEPMRGPAGCRLPSGLHGTIVCMGLRVSMGGPALSLPGSPIARFGLASVPGPSWQRPAVRALSWVP